MIRDLLWRALRWFFFQLDAEKAHKLTLALIRLGIRLNCVPLRWMSGAPSLRKRSSAGRTVFGLEFLSPVGLAAGFDKDAEILTGLPSLGFGFAEIGTVTPRPQPGNPLPRLFRKPEEKNLFNRMGFNSLGSTIVSERLARKRKLLPPGFQVGVNIGKNKETPLEEAHRDYVSAARAFQGLADYLVINVSSPNTPGLRTLQTVEGLEKIIEDVHREISSWPKRPPLLLKLAPEVSEEALSEIIPAGEEMGIDGWVLTNTLAGEWKTDSGALSGGWSGHAVREASRRALFSARRLTRKPIISVGGILDPEEARMRIEAGADLIQLYTGWVYGGPAVPVKVSRELEKTALFRHSEP